jgi:hypothetical protein
MRKYAYEHGQTLIPRAGKFESLYYALDLNDPNCSPTPLKEKSPVPEKKLSTVLPPAIFVSPSGDGTAMGSKQERLQFIQLFWYPHQVMTLHRDLSRNHFSPFNLQWTVQLMVNLSRLSFCEMVHTTSAKLSCLVRIE